MTPGINEDYNWRQVPAYQECRVNIYPTEPSVPSANVNTFFVNETKLFLNITLVAPNTPYGDIESYEVVIVREPVPDEEDPLNLNLVRRSELKVYMHGCSQPRKLWFTNSHVCIPHWRLHIKILFKASQLFSMENG